MIIDKHSFGGTQQDSGRGGREEEVRVRKARKVVRNYEIWREELKLNECT